MTKKIFVGICIAALLSGTGIVSHSDRATGASGLTFSVVPFVFDPHGTNLVAAMWKGGIGCPTNAKTVPFKPPNFDTLDSPMSYTDPACPIGASDPQDPQVQGLLLAKTGPSNDDASAQALITIPQDTTLTELGYDIRKPGTAGGILAPSTPFPGDQKDPRGSHCGGGAPRFNIVIDSGDHLYFIACDSPTTVVTISGVGWLRLRWGGSTGPLVAASQDGVCHDAAIPLGAPFCNITGLPADSLTIVFDEGQDPPTGWDGGPPVAGPDNFGLAVLDNIDVNGTLVGKGPSKPEESDRDEGKGKDGDDDHFAFHDSPSRPESSSVSYQDPAGVRVQSLNGARSVTYNGACVTLVGDALLNDRPGYVMTFAACSLPVLGGIGNFSMVVTGPLGVVYQKSEALTEGYMAIHPH
jgi:hypothetical protein